MCQNYKQKPLMCLPQSDDFQHALSTCFRFGGLKNLPPNVNDLFRGIPFSHEDKVHEQIQESLLLRRRTKGNFSCCFRSFFQVFERGGCRKSPISTGRNDRLKPGKLLNLIWHIRVKEDSSQHHCFDIQGSEFCQTPGVFIDSPAIKFEV